MREGSDRFNVPPPSLPHHSGAEAAGAGAVELRAQGSTLLGDEQIQCPHTLFPIIGNHYLPVV